MTEVAYWWTWMPESSVVARYCSHDASVRIRFGGQQAHGYQLARSPKPGAAADWTVRRWSGFS